MLVKWLPTTNGTWVCCYHRCHLQGLITLFQINNNGHECHRLKKDEMFPLLDDISFAPSVDRYGKPTGPNDYLYSFQFYTEHEVEECLGPDELLKRKKARARFKTARLYADSIT